MADIKRFFWLRLKDDFFDEKHVRALRKLPDGDALVIVYLKLQLKSLRTEGVLSYDHILPSYTQELALAIDEDEAKVRLAVEALLKMGICELLDDEALYMRTVSELTGSEGTSAERMRRSRSKVSQCDAISAQCDSDVRTCDSIASHCCVEIEIEKRRDREEIEKRIDIASEIVRKFNSICLSLPKVRALTDARRVAIDTMVSEIGLSDLYDAFEAVEQSDFLSGRSGAWNGCCFDWILKPGNMAKIRKGNFKNKTATTGRYAPTYDTADKAYLQEWCDDTEGTE